MSSHGLSCQQVALLQLINNLGYEDASQSFNNVC